jgi:circadian clock protein KaiB
MNVTDQENLQKNLKALSNKGKEHYTLKLLIAGMTPKSMHAVENIKKICEQYLGGRYNLAVVDIYHHPDQATKENIVAVPTLIKQLPLPLRKFIGDLSDSDHIIVGLDLIPHDKEI